MNYFISFVLFCQLLLSQNTFSQRPNEGLDIINQKEDLKRNKVASITFEQYTYKNNKKNETGSSYRVLSKELYDITGFKYKDIGYTSDSRILTQTEYRLLDSDREIIRTETYINKDTIKTIDTVFIANIIRHDSNILSNSDFKGFYKFTYDKKGLITQAIWYKRNGESSDIKDMIPIFVMKLLYSFRK